MTPSELQAWRAQSGYTQEELAKWLGMNAMTISKYERGVLPIKPLVQWALFGLKTDQENRRTREVSPIGRDFADAAKERAENPEYQAAKNELTKPKG